jgi:pimeloyl-ACP methyl ester carboxylesterase
MNMHINKVKVQRGRVTTEGDDLYFDMRGQGPPVLLIAGGGGDGKWYTLVANILSDEYKVITYDRRANARSTMNYPDNFDIHQQSRDAAEVIRAAGETSAIVFGNSSGAVVALDMAITQPQAVRAVVVHEPPLTLMHQNTNKWKKFFAKVYLTSFRMGGSMAMFRFLIGIGLIKTTIQSAKAVKVINNFIGEEDAVEKRISTSDGAEYFAKQELLQVTNYYPDLEKLKENGVKVFLAAGKMSLDKKRFYAQTVPKLAEKIGCEMVVFPGHHGSFMDMPEEWAATLRRILHKVN